MEADSQRQQAIQRPPYPQISTNTAAPSQANASSAFNSFSSLASVPSSGSISTTSTQSLPVFAQQSSAAPLPSPLVGQSSSYFGSINASAVPLQTQTSAYVGQRGGGAGGAPETAPFLDNANLLAEAAKRAQMACLMRDLGDVEL